MTLVHGALDHAELEALALQPHDVLDFSSNINPFGPPTAVRNVLAALDPSPYPDRSYCNLRRTIAKRHGCAPSEVLPGNGSNELIHLIAHAFLEAGDTALVIEPTFGEYAHASRLAGAQVVSWRAREDECFQIDGTAITRAIHHHRPRLVWLCAPNNPTGVRLSELDIASIVAACQTVGGWLVLDRAYADLERGWNNVVSPIDAGMTQHVIRLYSLTKSYALAGLRLGYMLADATVVERVATYQPAWSVNSAAQGAALAALSDPDFLPTRLPLLWQCSDQLRTGLEALGVEVLPSALPFMLVQTGDGARTRAALLRRGYVVRDCTSFGLPEYVRVAPRRWEDNRRLIQAWRDVCQRQS
jgi:histidinol-phosphate aminotransferase